MGSNLHKQEYQFTNFAIANKAFKDSRKMDLGALAWVERSNKIMIERGEGGISFKGLTYKLIASPNTGRVWLDRNLSATQVATTIGDSAAYGDYFPFSSRNFWRPWCCCFLDRTQSSLTG
jgi:hypothetical protein